MKGNVEKIVKKVIGEGYNTVSDSANFKILLSKPLGLLRVSSLTIEIPKRLAEATRKAIWRKCNWRPQKRSITYDLREVKITRDNFDKEVISYDIWIQRKGRTIAIVYATMYQTDDPRVLDCYVDYIITCPNKREGEKHE